MTIISLIVAMGNNQEIGFGGDLPWGRTLKDDLRHFKELTVGRPLLMGSKTAFSLKKPLPDRQCYVLTHHPENLPEGFIHVQSVEDWVGLINGEGQKAAVIIGGSSVYEQGLPFTQRMYITRVEGNFPEADVFFPDYQPDEWWLINERRQKIDERNAFNLGFETWERRAR